MDDTNGRTAPRAPRVRVLQSAGLVIALVITSAPLSFEKALGQDATCETAEFSSSDSPKAIPDRGTAESTITVPQGSPIQDVAVLVDITHTFDSDLRLELVSPSGRKVVLAEAVGTWGDDFSGTTFDDQAATSIVSSLPPFSGRYRPAAALAAFAGLARAGTWTLKITDLRARYFGMIEAWGLTLVTCAEPTVTRTPAGALDPPPLPAGVPAGDEGDEGRLITVATSSDVSDGDVSTVDALESNPGPDGISLREAIAATNNDPGTYTVRFDPSLTGGTIGLTNSLPPLRGGGVFIDGDIDGDGSPDVSLVNQSGFGGEWAFNVASSDNRLHALSLRDFTFGVVFTAWSDDSFEAPLLTDGSFERNVVSGLTLTDVASGVTPYPTLGHQECKPQSPCRTGSRWLDTRVVGNSIESRTSGAIWLGWIDDNGNVMRRTTVGGNAIHIGDEDVGIGISQGKAIDLGIGTGGTRGNLISDALVAYNSIEVQGRANAVQVLAGQQGRSNNVVENVRIVGNAVRFPSPRRGTEAVAILVSDDCWPPASGADCENVVRDVEVVGNALEGSYVGVRVGEVCCGPGAGNTLKDVRIAGNVIKAVVLPPTEFLNPWGIVIGGAEDPGVSNISVDSNTVVQTTSGATGNHAEYVTSGGIAVVGGLGKPRASARGVTVTSNRVDTKLIGILLLGGGPSGERSGQDNAVGNRASRVELIRNVIVRPPGLATRWFSKIKGISLIGGLGGAARPNRNWKARRNKVTCVTVRRNIVAGKRNKIAVLPNLGAGASRNVARLGGC